MLSAPAIVDDHLAARRPPGYAPAPAPQAEPASGSLARPLVPSFATLVGETPGVRQLRRRLGQLAGTAQPVLVTGEPGTGKHLLAYALHQQSPRRGPLLSINAVGLPAEDLMLHLYGQERPGRRGGADITPGLLERAHGGTLLFEEVAQLDAGGQRCLGKLLGEPTYARRGSAQLRYADVRVIVMTSQPLLELVGRGAFSEALFHRLTAAWLDVPPLRQRRDDIPRLAAAFLAHDQPPAERPIELPTATLLRLLGYGWPGNVRELRELLRQAAHERRQSPPRPQRRYELGPELIAPLLARTRAPDEARFRIGTPLTTVQREVILMTLAAVDGNKKDAAALLGLSRGALYSRLRSYSAQARTLWRAAQQRSLESLADAAPAASRAARTPRKSDSPPGAPAVEPIHELSASPLADAQEDPSRAQAQVPDPG